MRSVCKLYENLKLDGLTLAKIIKQGEALRKQGGAYICRCDSYIN